MNWRKLILILVMIFAVVPALANDDTPDFETLKEQSWSPFFDLKTLGGFHNTHDYVEAASRAMLNQSEQIVDDIIRVNQSSKSFVVDVVGIGAGANSAQAFSALKQSNPNLKMLVFEANKTTSVFDEMGSGFRVNSVETPGHSANFFSTCPLQVRDLNEKGDSYVNCQVMGDVVKMGFHYSRIPIVFSQPVLAVEERSPDSNWIARYKITTKGGLTVYANQVIAATGMGQPKLSIGDQSTQNLIEQEERASRKALNRGDTSYVPAIESVDSYLKRASAKVQKQEDPVQESQGLTVAVIGGKDGGNIAIESLTGIHERHNPTGKTGANIVWIGCHRNKADFLKRFEDDAKKSWRSSYLNQTRKERYADIGRLFDEGIIETTPGLMQSIERIQEMDSDGKSVIKYLITVKTQTGEAQRKVDRIVLAVGYQNNIDQLFKISLTESERVFADTSDCTLNPNQSGWFPVARKFKNHDIWVIGNATDKWADRILRKEDWSLSNGGGNLDILGTRSATVGRMIGKEAKPLITSRLFKSIRLEASEGSVNSIILNKTLSHGVPEGAMSVIRMENKLETAQFLNQFRIYGGMTTPINITFEKKEANFHMTVKGLDEKSSKKLIKLFTSNPSLCQSFEALMSEHRKVFVTVIPRKEDGSFRVENMSFVYEPTDAQSPLMKAS